MFVLQEIMSGMLENSRMLYLDFGKILHSLPQVENMSLFFDDCESRGIDPKAPIERQRFSDSVLSATGAQFLIGAWGEDRAAWLRGSLMEEEGRTIHLAIDIFSRGLEPVLAPCNGRIVRTGYEEHLHGYGHYLIIQPDEVGAPFVFMGHLSSKLPELGRVNAGQVIASEGDFVNQENGGWSRHVHLQMLQELPPEGETPIGYSTREDFAINSQLYPNPFNYYPGWKEVLMS